MIKLQWFNVEDKLPDVNTTVFIRTYEDVIYYCTYNNNCFDSSNELTYFNYDVKEWCYTNLMTRRVIFDIAKINNIVSGYLDKWLNNEYQTFIEMLSSCYGKLWYECLSLHYQVPTKSSKPNLPEVPLWLDNIDNKEQLERSILSVYLANELYLSLISKVEVEQNEPH